METFKDILTRQVDTLQSYFDTCAGTLAAHKAETHRQENGGGDFDSDDELDDTLRDSLQYSGKMFGENGLSSECAFSSKYNLPGLVPGGMG